MFAIIRVFHNVHVIEINNDRSAIDQIKSSIGPIGSHIVLLPENCKIARNFSAAKRIAHEMGGRNIISHEREME